MSLEGQQKEGANLGPGAGGWELPSPSHQGTTR